jgi:hypothetical protein
VSPGKALNDGLLVRGCVSPLFVIPPRVHTFGGPHAGGRLSVSAKGCGIAWSRPVPAIGEPLHVRLGAGSQTATFRSVVCWTAQAGRAPTIGLRFVDGPRGAWASLLTVLEGSGAPIA